MNLRGKTVVVTGGAGFIGSHLVDRIIEKEPKDLIVISNFFLGKIGNLVDAVRKFPVRILNNDLANREFVGMVFGQTDIDVVFNLAVVPLPTSLERPEWTVWKNVEMTLNLCEQLRLGNFKKLVQFSSSEAYGTTIYSPMKEDHPVNPTTPYGASKLATDYISLSYHKTFGCDVSVIRPFNAYGPRQNMGQWAGLIPLTVNGMRSGGPIFINGDGEQTRDYTFVTDIADAAIKICECQEAVGRVVNIGSGREISINEIVRLIADYMSYKGKIIHRERRPGEVQRLIADIGLACELFRYGPGVDFENGIKLTVDWYANSCVG